METIQVVIDAKLLEATDQAARRIKSNRSALVRAALREHLRGLEIRELEARDRQGYQTRGDQDAGWEEEAQWPAE